MNKGVTATNESVAYFCHLTFQASTLSLAVIRNGTFMMMRLKSSRVPLFPFWDAKQRLISVEARRVLPEQWSQRNTNFPNFVIQSILAQRPAAVAPQSK
jgi:hypothetical protein